MSLIRVQTTAQVTLSHTFFVDGVATAPTGTLQATVKRLDGTQVAGSPFTYTLTGTTCSFALPAQPQVDILTVDWSGTIAGAVVVARDIVEIVGGFLFGLQEAREFHKWTNQATHPTSLLAERRVDTEDEAEAISGRAWVPRFARFVLDGSGTDELVVPDMQLRALRAASLAPRAGGVFTALTAEQVAAVAAEPEGVLVRDDGGTWPRGRRNVIVEYEHGHDAPTPEVHVAAMTRLKDRIAAPRSAVPARALSWTTNEGGTYRLTTAGRRSTGDSEVDAAYRRVPYDRVWIAG